MYDKEIRDLKSKFEKIIGKLKEDFAAIRTGRASAGLVENIMVSYYGSTQPLKQMATLTTPDPTQIVIQPWDKNALGDIELAVRNSQTGLSASSDGNVVRVSIPPMTQEHREELIRNIARKGEEARIALRSVRGETWEAIKKMEKTGDVTEDDRYSAEKELNDLINDYNKTVQQTVEQKEKDLRAI
jgi:ribosome recycling factor